MTRDQALHDAHIVVTRPADRGENLCRRIEAAGGHAHVLPTIAIRPLPDFQPPPGPPADWLVFASVTAVMHGAKQLRDHMSKATRVAAIGNATATALRDAGWQVDAVPEVEESEGLLAHPALKAQRGKRVWIVRGRGGREVLADGLRERGARIAFVEVYARELPRQDSGKLLEWWQRGEVDAVVVSSRAGLENLHAMLDEAGRRYLRETQLVMPTARMLKLALELDIRPAPVIADGASDDAFMAALSNWWRERRQDSR